MNASDRRRLVLLLKSKDVRASLKSFLAQPKRFKKPIQREREEKEKKERLTKKERRAKIRAIVFWRAGGFCELTGAPLPTEWHHLLSGNGRRQQKESVENTMAVTTAAHVAYHRSPAAFAGIVAAWCAKHRYPPIQRIEHAKLSPDRRLSAVPLGPAVDPGVSSQTKEREC